MNAGQIYRLAQFALDDLIEPYQFTEEKALAYLNEAEREAADRSRLLVDVATEAVCRYAVTTGNALVTLDRRILQVRQAWWSGRTGTLAKLCVPDMTGGWEQHTGNVTGYLPDYQTGALRLYRIPVSNGTLSLRVVRLPLAELVGMSDTPEIGEAHHDRLASWLVYRARSIEDTELYDPRKAQASYQEFESYFGPRRSAQQVQFEKGQPTYGEWE